MILHPIKQVICAVIVTATLSIVSPVEAQIFVRIPDKDIYVNEILEDQQGKIWLSTENGAYKVEKGKNQAILIQEIEETNVNRIFEDQQGQLWFSTYNGTYRVKQGENQAILIKGTEEMYVHQIFEDRQGQIWLETDGELYQVEQEKNRAFLIKGTKGESIDQRLEDQQGQIWLTTYNGAYRVKQGENQAILIKGTEETHVYQIFEDRQGQIWLTTHNGTYRVEQGKNQAILIKGTEEKSVVEIFETSQEQIVLGTVEGAYWVEQGKNQAILIKGTEGKSVNQIFGDRQGQIWLSTYIYNAPYNETYRVKQGQNQAILIKGTEWKAVDQILEDRQGQIWLGTENGVYRVEQGKNQAILIKGTEGKSVYQIFGDRQGQIWLRTDNGDYRVEQGKNQAILIQLTQEKFVSQIFETQQGEFWLTANHGAYRYDENVHIDVAIESGGNIGPLVSFLNRIFPNRNYISPLKLKPCYTTQKGSNCDPKYDPYPKSFPREFDIIVESDKQDYFNRQVQEKRYQALDNGIKQEPIGNGNHELFISVRDKWGNVSAIDPKEITVGDWKFFASIGTGVIIILGWGCGLIALIIAPWNQYCHDLLMNPLLRKYASFGFIPIALSFIPPLRNHILKRYLRKLRQDEQFSQWQDKFIVPSVDFFPDKFGEKIKQKRTIFLQGQSGIGKTAYFQYLTDYYSNKKHYLIPKNVIPVFIPLSRYRANNPETMFQIQLENYGRLFDKELTAWFLKQGNFLIFLDGLNELSEGDRQKINTFVNQYSQANYFCLSSQENYPSFNLPLVELAALGKTEIEKLLLKRLGKEKTKTILKQFTQSSYELYKIPQNLEFAVELIKNNYPLPQSQKELYEAILQPIFDEWENKGQSDFDDILFKKSYNMLINHNQFFNQSEPKAPDELRNELIKQKFLVQRGENYHFQHDLIRAYLASQYFTPNWQELIKEKEIKIDENWRSLLEFSLSQFTQPEAAKSLLLIILEKNPTLAGKVFKNLQKTRPDLCEHWSDEFLSHLGKQLSLQIK